jgi:methyltransferase family protein
MKLRAELAMNLRYLRFNAFTSLMRPFSRRVRRKRMRVYVALMGLKEGMSVLDLGGQPMIWDSVPARLDLTILNLPGVAERSSASHHKIRYVEGDACSVTGFEGRQFDNVFSNSVIEHVGSADKQADFAREVRRLGKSYWVQTPTKWFPIEAHCGMPFWWFYPRRLRQYFIEGWRRKLPAWTEMVEGTRVLTRSELQRLFPEATIRVETVCGIPKSYIAYFRAR